MMMLRAAALAEAAREERQQSLAMKWPSEVIMVKSQVRLAKTHFLVLDLKDSLD
jgi:hypothetical protein